jgi:hypothetical protein
MTFKFFGQLRLLCVAVVSSLWILSAAATEKGLVTYRPEGSGCAVHFATSPMFSISKEDEILYANWHSGKQRAQIQIVVSCGDDFEKALDEEGFCRRGKVWVEGDGACRKGVHDTRSKNWNGASGQYYQGGYFCRVAVAKSKKSGAYFKTEFCAADSQFPKVSTVFGKLEQLIVDDVKTDAPCERNTKCLEH